MHIYMMTRGIKTNVDKWITLLQGIFLPFTVKKQGTAGLTEGENTIQMSVRPIQLWEVVFPQEQYDLVANTLFYGTDAGETQHKKHNKFIWGIRKALGVDKLKPFKKDKVLPAGVFRQDVEAIAIGMKEDYKFEDGTEAI